MDIPNLNSFAQISGAGNTSRQREFMSLEDAASKLNVIGVTSPKKNLNESSTVDVYVDL